MAMSSAASLGWVVHNENKRIAMIVIAMVTTATPIIITVDVNIYICIQ
jgi:hypothetical protein